MNTDYLYKSSTTTCDDQFDMMLMLHMDKLSANNNNDSPNMMSFSGNPTSVTTTMAPVYDCNNNNNHNNNSDVTLAFSGNTSARNHTSYSPNNIPIQSSPTSSSSHQKHTSMAAMREMIFRIAAMQPIYIDPESVKPPKRRNVRISKDPQSVAARHRRERISERIRILQRLVPGGTKMDTASMLDEAIHYVKFLKSQVQTLERAGLNTPRPMQPLPVGFPVAVSNRSGFYPVTGGNKGIMSSGYVMSSSQVSPTMQYVQQFCDDS